MMGVVISFNRKFRTLILEVIKDEHQVLVVYHVGLIEMDFYCYYGDIRC